jgi:hypothetical protein
MGNGGERKRGPTDRQTASTTQTQRFRRRNHQSDSTSGGKAVPDMRRMEGRPTPQMERVGAGRKGCGGWDIERGEGGISRRGGKKV